MRPALVGLASSFLTFAVHAQTISLPLSNVTQDGSDSSWMLGFPYGGGSQYTLPSNSEAETYSQAGTTPTANGSLTLTAAPNTDTSAAWPQNLPYTSGAISSASLNNGMTAQGGFAATYGTFSMTATLPAGSGLWPAFWLMPLNPSGGQCEIDVMENLGASNTYYATIHFPGSTSADSVPVPIGNTTQTNTYSVDWEPNTITFLLNGQQVAQFPTPSTCHSPEYILANLAVGGAGSWPGQYTGGTASMNIQSITYTPGANGQILAGSGLASAGTTVPAATVPSPASSAAEAPAAAPASIPTDKQNPGVLAPTMPASCAPDATSPMITPGDGSLTDAQGNVWDISVSGSIQENGQWVSGGGGTSALQISNGIVYGRDAGQGPVNAGGCFTLNGQNWTPSTPGPVAQPASAPATPATPAASPATSQCTPTPGGAATGNFTTQNGQIIAPDGSVFIAKGINLYDADIGAASQILADFPGINFIRLASYTPSTDTADYFSGFISQMTARGVVVEIEHHIGAGGGVPALTGSDLAAENAWFGSLASAFKSNSYVWFGTINEPASGGGLGAEQASNIQTIRGAGNNNIIMISAPVEADVSGASNVVVDQHFYGWEAGANPDPSVPGYNPDQAVVTAALTNSISQDQQLTTATGKIPLIIGETGPSTDGQNLDANAQQVLTADQSSGYGNAYWNWASGAPQDNLTDGAGNLTSYGQNVAGYIGLIANAPASVWAAVCPTASAASVTVAQAGSPAATTTDPTSTPAQTAPPDAVTSATQANQAAQAQVDTEIQAVDQTHAATVAAQAAAAPQLAAQIAAANARLQAAQAAAPIPGQ